MSLLLPSVVWYVCLCIQYNYVVTFYMYCISSMTDYLTNFSTSSFRELSSCIFTSFVPSRRHTRTSKREARPIEKSPKHEVISTILFIRARNRAAMFALSEESKERISKIIEISRVAMHYGYLPLILYLGYTRSDPRPSIIRLLSPLY
ncbi:TOM7 family-domain-containing protein [Nemania sp. NC0429]|nr:TOM7 family-domain-containing protein [Nemania sp. NC0429]